jgi:transaldolase
MSKLHDLFEAGQSVWYDFIRRDMLENGELDALVANGIRGLTSNPTIFQKAVAGSTQYDAQISTMVTADPDVAASHLLEEIAIRDIQGAADALAGVYADSDGQDGFVSLEVSPHLANDTAGTIADAHRLWEQVDRPNLMIKVPATPAGIPAVEELIAANINVNATLMFSLEDYENVAQAYLRGLARAQDPHRVASVASFFVSRVDTKTDAALEKVGTADAMARRGRTAVANAKLAYRRYQQLFEGDGFAALAAKGGRPQRALWASTSTKNPEYSDVLYVDDLVGPNTVNTMPPQTVDDFIDHGVIDASALTADVDDAIEQIDALADLGIDFDEITADLQTEGVASFADSYDELLTTLADKAAALRS